MPSWWCMRSNAVLTSASGMRWLSNPDYSAAYVILKTDSALEGHGFAFRRGNETAAARS